MKKKEFSPVEDLAEENGRVLLIRGVNGEVMLSSGFLEDSFEAMAEVARKIYQKGDIVKKEVSYFG